MYLILGHIIRMHLLTSIFIFKTFLNCLSKLTHIVIFKIINLPIFKNKTLHKHLFLFNIEIRNYKTRALLEATIT